MYILGNVNTGMEPDKHSLVLSDGRVVGPFESDHARGLFERWFSKKAASIFEAGELFEGSVVGEDYMLLRTDEASLETHPFIPIHDILLQADNGRPVFEMLRGPIATDPRQPVFVSYPERQLPERHLTDPLEPEFLNDLEPHSKPTKAFPSKFHGEIAVFEGYGGKPHLVCWRRDGRRTQGVVGLSLHTHLDLAEKAARDRAWDFKPPFEKLQNRERDGQREKLYLWEHSFQVTFKRLADIEEAAELANMITEELGVPRVVVSAGRANLITKSYYRAGEVVLNRQMMDNHTVVHEIAHHAVRRMPKIREPSHGPIFAGVLLALMTEYMEADQEQAIDNARERGVVVDLDTMRAVRQRIAERRREQTMDQIRKSATPRPN